jgi:6-phosphofructokinase 1
LEGGNAAMVSIQNGRLTPIPFDQILDPATGRTRLRMVDVQSESYQIARRYMIRLSSEDFDDAEVIAQYAAMLKIPPASFRDRFRYLVADASIS